MTDNLQPHNSKLFLLLRALDKKERKQFDLWLSSPFHNTSEKTINLYRGLMTQYKGFDKPISKTVLVEYIGISNNLSGELSPKEDVVLRKVMTQLTKQIQEFLIWQQSKKNIIYEKRLLMDAMLERKLYSLIPVILTKSKKELEILPYRSVQYYENAFQIAEMDFFLGILLTNRNSKIQIQQTINVLWLSVLAKVLQYYCAAKNRERTLRVK